MSTTPQTPYQILGEDGIRTLVNTFYDLMESAPEHAALRRMHAKDLTPMREKLAEYLIGWMGGPPLYADKYGTVCMTEPHEPYWIGPEERDQWLRCMYQALEQSNTPPEAIDMLREPLYRVAEAVRNRPNSRTQSDDVIASG